MSQRRRLALALMPSADRSNSNHFEILGEAPQPVEEHEDPGLSLIDTRSLDPLGRF